MQEAGATHVGDWSADISVTPQVETITTSQPQWLHDKRKI